MEVLILVEDYQQLMEVWNLTGSWCGANPAYYLVSIVMC